MNTLITIVGPTAVGKTEMAVRVARHFGTEVASADSRQIFKEMNIGTAKPSLAEMHGVRHHFVDEVSVSEDYSAGRFEQEAMQRLNEIFTKHDLCVLCGGSGLYVKAITEGLNDMPVVDEATRAQLNHEYQEHGILPLQEELKAADPLYYSTMDVNNPQRLIRALEVYRSIGIPFSEMRTGESKSRDFNVIKIGLDLPRNELYARIDARVDRMINAGLLEEVRELHHLRHFNSLQTVGYQEIFTFLDDKIDWDEAVRLIKRNSRRFAKRQLTWFRKDSDIAWFHPSHAEEIIKFLELRIRKLA